MPTFDPQAPIVIVGAGIIGASTALHLVEAGAQNVTVVDAGTALSGTTTAGAGFVARFAADHDRRLGEGALPLEEHGLAFYRGLHDDGVDVEFSANGNIALARTDETLARYVTGILQHPLATPGAMKLTPDEVAERTSGAVDPAAVTGGVFMPEGIQLTTGRALAEVLRRLEHAGARMLWNTEVRGVRETDGRVAGVNTSAGVLEASAVVLAAGAWMPQLLDAVGYRLPLIPTVATRFVSTDAGLAPTMPSIQSLDMGQGLWLRELNGAFSWGVGAAYRRVSRLAVEEGLEFGYGRPVSPTLIARQREQQAQVAEAFPALAGLEAETIIQGVPVYSADGGLYAGSVPGHAGLWAITGDNESGVTHGPGLGRLVAELVAGIDPYADPTPFRLDRIDPATVPDEDAAVTLVGGDRVATALD